MPPNHMGKFPDSRARIANALTAHASFAAAIAAGNGGGGKGKKTPRSPKWSPAPGPPLAAYNIPVQ